MKRIGEMSYENLQLEIHKAVYQYDGDIAIVVTTLEGEPYATVSTNLRGAVLGENEFCVQNWNLGERLVKALLETGLFEDTEKRIASGFVYAPIWKLK